MGYNRGVLITYLGFKRGDDSETRAPFAIVKAWKYLLGWRTDVTRKDAELILFDVGYTMKQIKEGYVEATRPREKRRHRPARTGPVWND